MHLEAQKQLLADLQSAEKRALALLGKGVKLTSVVKKIRAAVAELETRVRFIEKNSPPTLPPRKVTAPKVDLSKN